MGRSPYPVYTGTVNEGVWTPVVAGWDERVELFRSLVYNALQKRKEGGVDNDGGLRFAGMDELRKWVGKQMAGRDADGWKNRGYRDQDEFVGAVAEAIRWIDGFAWNHDARPVVAPVMAHGGLNDLASALEMA